MNEPQPHRGTPLRSFTVQYQDPLHTRRVQVRAATDKDALAEAARRFGGSKHRIIGRHL